MNCDNLVQLRKDFQESCARDVPGVMAARTYATRFLEELRRHMTALAAASADGWCAAAVGGFGRGQLSFASDLDLVFLHRRRLPSHLEAWIRQLIPSLWDAGFEVGHMVTSPKDLKNLMRQDFTAQTTFMEAALAGGDAEFYRRWRKEFLAGFSQTKRARFLVNLREYRKARYSRYGESSYLLEPHLKEGVGSLRDIHTIRWMGVMFLGTPSVSALKDAGWLSSEEALWLEQAEDFLWRVRLQMHYLNGKRQDRLLMVDQEILAKRLGFLDGTEGSAVEAFMRLYYRHTARIRRITGFLLDRLSHETRKRRRFSRHRRTVLPGPFLLEDNHLSFMEPERIPERPDWLMTLFWEAAKRGAHFHHQTGRIVRENLSAVTDAVRSHPDVVAKFFDILLHAGRAFAVLRVMMETGFLQAFIPELASVRYRVQHDLYHLYTVDEHLLRTVREMHRLEQGLPSLEPQVDYRHLFQNLPHRRVLYLAALLHDVGKGQGKNHSVRGAEMSRAIAERLGLQEEEKTLLEFLIRHHLLLPETALKRDLSDEKPIVRCAMQIGSRTKLKLLYLLAVADSRATGPGAWNTWRASLMDELYGKVDRVLLRGEWQAEDVTQMVDALQAEVLALCDADLRPAIGRWLENLSLRYLLSQTPYDMVRHFAMEREVPHKGLVLEARPLEGELWQVTTACRDRPGLFATITGVLWLHGLNILSADIYTRSSGIALDILIVEDVPDPLHPEETWRRVQNDLSRCVQDPDNLTVLTAKHRPPMPRKCVLGPRKPDRVVLDESASDFYTVIEVYTWDRPGVLHAVTQTLYKLGLTIQLAKISTPGAQVVDVFYVTDLEGAKIQDPEKHRLIEERLLACLRSWDVPRARGEV
ncbi:[protein-PII] uridylyltransferase [Desulfosoma caldarium]|uniref:Bifunctional uridylyltransferase/uridylyl-removing enzyme n=1 Tax=Desulfosoma caldarium TaxID=610254 RepID=A0A3N1UY21_9BACT|nr:[protein-PII] uridylyltransferase [Desulfosoma caldarium]ROQ93590.1 UTP--GlnB (protein PII) uridylyltransferase GlnD [Desulfosoma caldarium]